LRYQHSVIDSQKHKDYLRNKLKIDYRFLKEMKPYAALESYHKLEKYTPNKYRLYIGCEYKILPKNKLENYYILEVTNDGKNAYISHMIGLFLII
jgi:hypothetical protein